MTGKVAQAAQFSGLFIEAQASRAVISSGSLAFADRVQKSSSLSVPAVGKSDRAQAAAAEEPASGDESPEPRVADFPDPDSGPADVIWSDFFSTHRPNVRDVRRQILKLHNAGRHQHVIAALEAALINGQSQPWMYEVLALSMEIEKYPKEEVERVVLSMTDFGAVDFESMIYSAAYLVRFGRPASALKLFRQAARLAPERHEPYELALEHARKLESIDDIVWAACGVLQYDWSRDHEAHHKAALDNLMYVERRLEKAGDVQRLEEVRAAVADARRIDLFVEVAWNGTADLDLEVEEPFGSICSISQPQTSAGGFLLNDGYGPEPASCHETYVCPAAPSGEFRIRVKQVSGNVVAGRATLTLILHQGSADEHREQRTLVLKNETAATTAMLDQGRRVNPRMVWEAARSRIQQVASGPSLRRRPTAAVLQASAEFSQSRAGAIVGAVGFQPIVQVIPDGATLGAQALVSPDRRYVRLGVNPVFSNVTDVFTFSFAGGQAAQVGGAGAAAGGLGGNGR